MKATASSCRNGLSPRYYVPYRMDSPVRSRVESNQDGDVDEHADQNLSNAPRPRM